MGREDTSGPLDGHEWPVVRFCLLTISCEYFWFLMRESRP